MIWVFLIYVLNVCYGCILNFDCIDLINKYLLVINNYCLEIRYLEFRS